MFHANSIPSCHSLLKSGNNHRRSDSVRARKKIKFKIKSAVMITHMKKTYLHFHPNTEVRGRSIYGAFLRQEDLSAQHAEPCWPWNTLILHSPHILLCVCYLYSLFLVEYDVMLQKDVYSELNWVYAWWLNGGEAPHLGKTLWELARSSQGRS